MNADEPKKGLSKWEKCLKLMPEKFQQSHTN